MSWLTGAIVTAIALFVLRETLEYFRRVASTGRQIEAHKTIIKRQCELDAWAVNRLRQTLVEIKNDPHYDFGLVQTQYSQRFEHDGNSWPIPYVHLDDFKEAMLSVATLQSDLFARLEHAYDECLNLENLRQQLVSYLLGEADFHVDGLIDYGLRELDDVFRALDTLYRSCTNGQNLDCRGRVR